MAQSTDSFKSMGFGDSLIKGLAAKGFNRPSALQQRAIVPILNGRDTVVQAPSGDDRTVTFSAPVLQKIDLNNKVSQALILVSRRELSTQLQKFMVELSGSSNVSIGAIVGGTNINETIKICQDGTQVIIGTPGRIFDMINRSYLKPDSFNTVVIDDADEAQYEVDQIGETLMRVNPRTQIVLLSAKASRLGLNIAGRYMRDVVRVSTIQDDSGVRGSKQYKTNLKNDEEKSEALMDFFEISSSPVIFCNTREKADWIVSKLDDMGRTATALYSDTATAARTKIAEDFKSGSGGALITSDPKASGVDLKPVTLSIGFELPLDSKDYIHRVTWEGNVINFVTSSDSAKVKDIEKLYSIQLEDLPSSGVI